MHRRYSFTAVLLAQLARRLADFDGDSADFRQPNRTLHLGQASSARKRFTYLIQHLEGRIIARFLAVMSHPPSSRLRR